MEVSSSAVQHEDIPISATRLAPKPTVTCGGGDGSVEVGAAPLAPGRCRSACQRLCRPFLLEFHPLPEGASRAATLHRALLCPPHGPVARLLTLAVVVVGVWAVLWAVTGDAALPGGNYFALVVLLAACIVCGAAVERLRLPALLGMLAMGFVLRNVPGINIAEDIDPTWSSALRMIALVVILTRAGLGLDPVALKKLSFGVVRLAFAPCLVEAVAAAVTSHLLLGFPWIWGLMLGFVLSAVSPAVVVPSMLALCEQGYGTDKGIPTLVIAASSLDDVLAISGFGVVLGIAFSKGNMAWNIVKGPLEALAGVVYGIVFGVLAWYLPSKKQEHKVALRSLLLLCGGLLAAFGSRRADVSGAGALGCLSMAFVAALGWRKELAEGEKMPLEMVMATLWTIFQPLLFGLIGAEIDITTVKAKTIGYGLAVLAIGLSIRVVVSFFVVFRLGLTIKEQLFISLAWLPKATVQAAIGSLALDTAREKNAKADQIEYGKQLLTIAVLVILITAPLGAVAIARSAPHLLQRAAVTSFDEEETRSDDLDDPDDPGENQREKEAEQDSTADVEIQSNGGRK